MNNLIKNQIIQHFGAENMGKLNVRLLTYSISHLRLLIRISHPELERKAYLFFHGVKYMAIPTNWKGIDIQIGSAELLMKQLKFDLMFFEKEFFDMHQLINLKKSDDFKLVATNIAFFKQLPEEFNHLW